MPKGNKPNYNARVKIGEDGEGKPIYRTIGAAWNFPNDGEGLSIRLQLIPTNWDGSFILVPPKDKEE